MTVILLCDHDYETQVFSYWQTILLHLALPSYVCSAISHGLVHQGPLLGLQSWSECCVNTTALALELEHFMVGSVNFPTAAHTGYAHIKPGMAPKRLTGSTVSVKSLRQIPVLFVSCSEYKVCPSSWFFEVYFQCFLHSLTLEQMLPAQKYRLGKSSLAISSWLTQGAVSLQIAFWIQQYHSSICLICHFLLHFKKKWGKKKKKIRFQNLALKYAEQF